jgi:hypothetical protein
VNHQGEPLPEALRNVDEKHLDPDGPPHPDRATEIKILRWAHGYQPWERDLWTGKAAQ